MRKNGLGIVWQKPFFLLAKCRDLLHDQLRHCLMAKKILCVWFIIVLFS